MLFVIATANSLHLLQAGAFRAISTAKGPLGSERGIRPPRGSPPPRPKSSVDGDRWVNRQRGGPLKPAVADSCYLIKQHWSVPMPTLPQIHHCLQSRGGRLTGKAAVSYIQRLPRLEDLPFFLPGLDVCVCVCLCECVPLSHLDQ